MIYNVKYNITIQETLLVSAGLRVCTIIPLVCFFSLRPRFRLFGLTDYSCAINAKNIFFYFNGFRILLAFFLFFHIFLFHRSSRRCTQLKAIYTTRDVYIPNIQYRQVIAHRQSTYIRDNSSKLKQFNEFFTFGYPLQQIQLQQRQLINL